MTFHPEFHKNKIKTTRVIWLSLKNINFSKLKRRKTIFVALKLTKKVVVCLKKMIFLIICFWGFSTFQSVRISRNNIFLKINICLIATKIFCFFIVINSWLTDSIGQTLYYIQYTRAPGFRVDFQRWRWVSVWLRRGVGVIVDSYRSIEVCV